MAGERADLLVARLAGHAVAQHERMPRPGPPLPGWLVPLNRMTESVPAEAAR